MPIYIRDLSLDSAVLYIIDRHVHCFSNIYLLRFSQLEHLQKKPDWSKGKPGDAKVKEEAEGVEAWTPTSPTSTSYI